MAIGFIRYSHEEGDLDNEQMLKESYEALLKEVQRYAALLNYLDPANFNAVQEMANVALMLSYAETSQDRLDTLTTKARHLMIAVSGAKRDRRMRWIISAVVAAGGICAATGFFYS